MMEETKTSPLAGEEGEAKAASPLAGEEGERPPEAEAEARVILSCAVCGAKKGRRCGRCREVAYCSVECQKKDFRKHRPKCDRVVRERDADDELKAMYGPSSRSATDVVLSSFVRVEAKCEICRNDAPFDEPWDRYRACCGARLCASCAGETPEQIAHKKMTERKAQRNVKKDDHAGENDDDDDDGGGGGLRYNACFCDPDSLRDPKPVRRTTPAETKTTTTTTTPKKKTTTPKKRVSEPCPFCAEVVPAGKEVDRLSERAESEGSGEAWYVFGYSRVHGAKKSRRDPVEGCKWLRKAARVGSYGALHELALCYRTGLTGKEKNPTLAAKMFKLAASKGVAKSLHSLARAYLDGTGVPKDSKEARRLLELGAASDYVPCKTSLAKLCIDGDADLEQDRVRAAKLLGLDRTADLLKKGFKPPDFLFKPPSSSAPDDDDATTRPIPDNEYTEEEMDEFFGADDTEAIIMGPGDTTRGIDSMAAAFAAAQAQSDAAEERRKEKKKEKKKNSG